MYLVGLIEDNQLQGFYPYDMLELYKDLPNKYITINKELHQYLIEKQYKIEDIDEEKELYTLDDKALFLEVEPTYQEVPKSEIEVLKEENEALKMAIVELDSQREQDKLDTQLAIAELTNALLGGE
jgi:hypothetical protein